MGGSVGLTIREPNGQEHRMCRWTNIMPSILNNLRLVNKDSTYVQDIVKMWYDMRKDYEAHKTNEKFENNMSPIYAPHPFLAPCDYGLIVVDIAKNQILDYQGYCGLGKISSVSIRSDITENKDGGHTLLYIGPESQRPKQVGIKKAFDSDDEYSSAIRFKRFYDAGRVTQAVDERTGQAIPLNGKSLDDIAEMIMSRQYYDFPLDISPFQITRYHEHNPEDARKMQSRIEELGFKLTDQEKSVWDEWVKENSYD